MKKFNSVLLIGIMFCCMLGMTTSCLKWNPSEVIKTGNPSKMPGLGNNENKIEGPDWTCPAGISVGAISGYSGSKSLEIFNNSGFDKKNYDFSSEENQKNIIQKDGESSNKFGSGYYVQILVPITNSTTNNITVEFPKATIFECSSNNYQNGLLIKKVSFVIHANSTRNIILYLYCSNLSRHASDSGATYNRIIVCTYQPIVDLCKLFENKKVNIEEPNNDYYASQVSKIQNIVWNLTQLGITPSTSDKEWINSIPNSN